MTILHLENVSFRYDNAPVLRGITADFEAGKLYAILGKSGAGKTTLLSLMAGLGVCTGGAILYKGTDLKEINRDRYRAASIGVIFQSYNLLPAATAVENIVLAMHLSGEKCGGKKEAAYRLLEQVGIDRETAGRKVLKLSGGEQQRVGIARALSHNPDILLADEPTGNLDEATEDAILDILLHQAKCERRCVILVTHSHKAASLCDEVLGLSAGRLVTVSQKPAAEAE